jgi:heme/copper-type cytochrome/quinol oxidase subunit 2
VAGGLTWHRAVMRPWRHRFVRILIELVVALASLVFSYLLWLGIAFSGFDQATPHPTATLLLKTSTGICIAATVALVVELVLAISAAVSRNRRRRQETALSTPPGE